MNDIIQKIIEAIDKISYKQPSNNSSNNSSGPGGYSVVITGGGILPMLVEMLQPQMWIQ